MHFFCMTQPSLVYRIYISKSFGSPSALQSSEFVILRKRRTDVLGGLGEGNHQFLKAALRDQGSVFSFSEKSLHPHSFSFLIFIVISNFRHQFSQLFTSRFPLENSYFFYLKRFTRIQLYGICVTYKCAQEEMRAEIHHQPLKNIFTGLITRKQLRMYVVMDKTKPLLSKGFKKWKSI